jgi:hypothetical protein
MSRYLPDLPSASAAPPRSAFLTIELANGADITNLGTLHAAAVAGLIAGATVIKGVLARFVGDPATASLLPRTGRGPSRP